MPESAATIPATAAAIPAAAAIRRVVHRIEKSGNLRIAPRVARLETQLRRRSWQKQQQARPAAAVAARHL